MSIKKLLATALAVVAAIALISAVTANAFADYRVRVVLPVASNLVVGSPVQIDGVDVGSVQHLSTRDGKAIVEIAVNDGRAPLTAGTDVAIRWKAVLGERIVELRPGEEKNATIPDGGLIEGTMHRVEIDEVLAALDPPTRKHVTSLVRRLDSMMKGSERDINETVRAAGPAVQALGQVTAALNSDGPAMRALVQRLQKLTAVLANREGDVRGVVTDLAALTDTTAQEHEALRSALRAMPSTLDSAQTTLGRVPSAAGAAESLLADLRPATKRLPSVAKNLSPLLRDLRPATADLKPTLAATRALLGRTPKLLDTAHDVFPKVTDTLDAATPALAFLRPYTPEFVGWLSNWNSTAGNFDANGRHFRMHVQGGSGSVNNNPGVLPPGLEHKPVRLPGELEGQPWTDAHGSGPR